MHYTHPYPSQQIESSIEIKGMKNQLVSLKNLNRDNLDDFYLWTSDPEITKYMTWEPYTNKSDALKFLIHVAEKHPWFKAICFENKIVGSITLTPGKGRHACRAELGYMLARNYWGKGLMTAVVKQAIAQGFKDLKIHRIEALVDPQNIASQRVLEKAGMKREGLLKNYVIFKGAVRDRYIYAITR